MRFTHGGTVRGVDLPMLRYWLEEEFLTDCFDTVLPANLQGLPPIPTFMHPPHMFPPTWYLTSEVPFSLDDDGDDEADDEDDDGDDEDDDGDDEDDDGDDEDDGEWEGYAICGATGASARYEWAMTFVHRDEGWDPALEDEAYLIAGAIRLTQRRRGEVDIEFADNTVWGIFFNWLIDWLWDRYECKVQDLPDAIGGPLRKEDSDKTDAAPPPAEDSDETDAAPPPAEDVYQRILNSPLERGSTEWSAMLRDEVDRTRRKYGPRSVSITEMAKMVGYSRQHMYELMGPAQ